MSLRIVMCVDLVQYQPCTGTTSRTADLRYRRPTYSGDIIVRALAVALVASSISEQCLTCISHNIAAIACLGWATI